jgi:hypothetical protein
MNLDVRRIGDDPASLRRFVDADPITFQYLSDLKIIPRLILDLSQTRAGIMGFLYRPASAHPLAKAFQAAKNETTKNDRINAVRSILDEFYGMVQPASALEIVDLTGDEAPGLVGIPLYSWVMPWSERSIEDTAAHRRISLEEEGIAKRTFVSIEDGATLFGPVTGKKLNLEVARISDLAESIIASGFQSNLGHPIEVIGMRAEGKYRWFVVQGQHRLAACAAFNIHKVPARVLRIIRRDDVEHWPHVVAKTFTAAGALKCFDRLFAGNVSACAASWSAFARASGKVEHEKAPTS